MNGIKKHVPSRVARLQDSERSLGDIYNIIFSDLSPVMCERATTLRIHRLTYGEVHARVEAVAAALREELRESGVRVGLCAENSIEWTVLFWAILRSGNLPVLIPPGRAEAVSGQKDLRLCTVLSVEEGEGGSLLYPALWKKGKAVPALPIDAPFGNEIVTCGANGETLSVDTGESVSAQVLAFAERVRHNADLLRVYRGKLKQLVLLPLSHVFGCITVYLCYAFFGATFVFARSTAPDALLESARRHDVTHIFAVPSFWNALEKAVSRETQAREKTETRKLERAIDRAISLQSAFPRVGRRITRGRMREWRDLLLPDSICFCLSVGDGDTQAARRLINGIGDALYDGYGINADGLSSIVLPKRAKERITASDASIDDMTAALYDALNEASGMEKRAYTGDGSEIRPKIRALFAEILGVSPETIPGDAHFMIDLGGSSLDYFTLIGELDREFGVQLPYENDDFSYSLDDFEQLVKETLKCTNSFVGSL